MKQFKPIVAAVLALATLSAALPAAARVIPDSTGIQALHGTKPAPPPVDKPIVDDPTPVTGTGTEWVDPCSSSGGGCGWDDGFGNTDAGGGYASTDGTSDSSGDGTGGE